MSVLPTLMKSFRASGAKAHGCLDNPENGSAKGWAFDPDNPSAPLKVELRIDGKPFQTVLADQYRDDLERAGMGTGAHGFRVALPRAFFDAKLHTLEARIVELKDAPNAVLQNSPISTVFDGPPSPPEPEPSPAQPPPGTSQPLPPGTAVAPESALAGLSVVIPTHNRAAAMERNLRLCLAAAANLAVEFIVIDDGSTDHTPARLHAMSAEFPNLRHRTVPHGGTGQARNIGVSMAAYELVLFLGDDVQPSTGDFFRHHINTHRMLPAIRVGVVGKIVWPNAAQERVSFLMAHIQGAGQQQFGFYNLLPYTWLDWRFFYTCNVSFKKSVVADWLRGGFSAEFNNVASQDAELGFRIDRALTGGFQILYCPAAAATHFEQYTVRQFIERQVAAGLAGRAFTRVHPEAAKKLGTDRLDALLASSPQSPQSPQAAAGVEDLIKMIEGAKSWGVVVEGRYNLGSQNWHADLLSAIFELSYLQGYVMASQDPGANYAAAFQYVLERFQEKMSSAASFEVFGRFPGFTLT
jgi:hypothetical protein